ncbi:hypothetical protein AGDE_14867 [Angomonas deanei]|nr:hypothetical protein AGDE_14867 [Angomonas deanei]|eukprot:EPY20084.1 hypothetical protein AGDE_14867 [Angomonas deanei]
MSTLYETFATIESLPAASRFSANDRGAESRAKLSESLSANYSFLWTLRVQSNALWADFFLLLIYNAQDQLFTLSNAATVVGIPQFSRVSGSCDYLSRQDCWLWLLLSVVLFSFSTVGSETLFSSSADRTRYTVSSVSRDSGKGRSGMKERSYPQDCKQNVVLVLQRMKETDGGLLFAQNALHVLLDAFDFVLKKVIRETPALSSKLDVWLSRGFSFTTVKRTEDGGNTDENAAQLCNRIVLVLDELTAMCPFFFLASPGSLLRLVVPLSIVVVMCGVNVLSRSDDLYKDRFPLEDGAVVRLLSNVGESVLDVLAQQCKPEFLDTSFRATGCASVLHQLFVWFVFIESVRERRGADLPDETAKKIKRRRWTAYLHVGQLLSQADTTVTDGPSGKAVPDEYMLFSLCAAFEEIFSLMYCTLASDEENGTSFVHELSAFAFVQIRNHLQREHQEKRSLYQLHKGVVVPIVSGCAFRTLSQILAYFSTVFDASGVRHQPCWHLSLNYLRIRDALPTVCMHSSLERDSFVSHRDKSRLFLKSADWSLSESLCVGGALPHALERSASHRLTLCSMRLASLAVESAAKEPSGMAVSTSYIDAYKNFLMLNANISLRTLFKCLRCLIKSQKKSACARQEDSVAALTEVDELEVNCFLLRTRLFVN